jgi:hypothetical protein
VGSRGNIKIHFQPAFWRKVVKPEEGGSMEPLAGLEDDN